MVKKITELFPLWAILFSILAFKFPPVFVPLKPAIVPLLGLVMFGMGIILTGKDFISVLQKPLIITLGVGMQFLLMPFIAWCISKGLTLHPEFTTGLVLVGSCPGGTASNVICYLAKGDVALSITLTSISTLLAFLTTPFLTWFYVGTIVSVPVLNMLFSILKIVILPVALGVLINRMWGNMLGHFRDVFPLISVISIVIIIAIIVSLNQQNILHTGLLVIVCVALHNMLGLASGFWISKSLKLSEKESRTLAIEVGMQNSGLGVALAIKHFSAAVALPGAIFSIWHNLSGSFLAGYWSKKANSFTAKSLGGHNNENYHYL